MKEKIFRNLEPTVIIYKKTLFLKNHPWFPCTEAELGEGAGGGVPSLCWQLLAFFNHLEEIQTALFEVELIVSNAPSTYVTQILSKHV